MKLIIITLLIFISQVMAFDNDEYLLELKANIAKAEIANDGISDKELLEFIEGMFKYLPEEFEEIKSKDSVDQKKSLNNFRHFYSSLGLSIPELIVAYEESQELKEFMAKTWANDTLGVEYAEGILFNLSKQEYKTIVDIGKNVVRNNKRPFDRLGRVFIHKDLPKQLNFVNIEYLVIYSNSVDFYLYKGIGGMKTIGYTVKKEASGEWKLYTYNFLKSWDKQLLDIESMED